MNLWKGRLDAAAQADAVTAVTAAQRRAALVLHALTPADQRWILQRMPHALQRRMRGLLRELGRLGIQPGVSSAASANFAAATVAASDLEAASDSCSSVPNESTLLTSAQRTALAQALDTAPTALRAYALAVLPAAEHAAITALLPGDSAQKLGGAATARNPAGEARIANPIALQRALLDYAKSLGDPPAATFASSPARLVEATS